MSLDNEHIQLPQLESWGDGAWRKRAACRGANTAVFFPEKGPLSVVHANKSKAYCMGCAVRFECLKFAVENSINVGTYGGVSPHDRRGLDAATLTPEDALISLPEAFAILKRAKDPSPIATLSSLIGESEDTVKDMLLRGVDYFL